MRKLLLVAVTLLSVTGYAQNVGIGTNAPQTKLHVAGAISSTPASAPAQAAYVIPDNTSVFRITSTAGAQSNALSMATPHEGQYLIIFNDDNDAATFGGFNLSAGATITLNYINNAWRLTGRNDAIGPTGATGVAGAAGSAGTTGADGKNAYTTTSAGFTQPVIGNNVSVSVANTSWMTTGQAVFVGGSGGYYIVNSIANGTTVVLTYFGGGGTGTVGATGSGVSASGQTGALGATGAQGNAGTAGPTGAQGNAGAAGPTGAQGNAGVAGVAGATGAQGNAGAAGPTGAQGNAGATGATGLLGAGTATGNTTYWNGSTWVLSSSNIYNNGGNVGIGTASPGTKLDVTGGAVKTDNQLISTVATGTAPLAVTSTTLVSNLNADRVDGRHLSEIQFMQSDRDFPNGTLIQSDIDYSVTGGDPWLLEIEGNSYGQVVPLDLKIQGYIYYDSLINVGGISNGTSITGLSAFNYLGKLCFWFPNQAYWSGYNVFINDSYNGSKHNRLVSVTHVAKPGGISKEVALTPKIRQSWHSGNFTPGSYPSGSGTPNTVSKFITSTSVGDSKITDDGVNTINAGSRWFRVNGKEAIDGNDSWLRLNQAGAYASGIYTPGFFRADGGIASGGLGAAAGIVNALTGFQINTAAATGSYLRGNGTNYVSSAIQAADVPTLNQNTTGYATYLKSPYPYNINISDATTAASLCEPASLSSVNMHASHGLFGSWATTLTMSGYDRYGAYQISGNYNAAAPELAIRNYVQGSNTWNSWVKLITTANIGSYADNLGNHTATTTLNMNGRNIAAAGDIVSDQQTGLGAVGLYDPTRNQNVWSMGASYRLPANGNGSSNLYGIAWSYEPGYGGGGNNAQSKSGLSHQALYMHNGVTQTAIGYGVWTAGNMRFGNYLIGNDKYAIDATDSWLRLNQQNHFGSGTYTPYLVRSDGGFNVDDQTVIDNDGGWHRSYGATGWYNGTYQGGWYMADGTWIRNYNNKQIYLYTAAGNNTDAVRVGQSSATENHALSSENDAWGLVGYSNRRWWVMYAYAGFGTSSLRHKTDVHELTGAEINKSLADVNKIQSITYKWNKSVWEEMNGKFAGNISQQPGEKTELNAKVPSWLGFSVESLPEGIVDETGENYQYGAMIGLLVSSTKALTKRTEILANALDIDFENLQTAKSVTKNVSDFGTASTGARETWVSFSDEFTRQLNGKTPTVTISSSQAGISLSVTEKSSKGFKVISSSDKAVDFDYIAMGKTTVEFPEYNSTTEKPVQKADINAWYADFSKKNKTLPQQVGNPAEEALTRQKKQTTDPTLKGTTIEPVKEVAPPPADKRD